MGSRQAQDRDATRFAEAGTGSFWRWAPWLCFGLFALLYGFGAQRTFYLHDGLQIVYTHLSQGNLAHPRHPLYLPLAAPFVEALAWTGETIHTRAVWFSGLSTAGAGLFVYLLARRAGLTRGGALVVQALFALSPAVYFFATVVEFHALFLLFAAMAFWWAEGLHQSAAHRSLGQRVLLAAILGGMTWTSAMAHSTGNLLLAPISCLLLVRAPLRRRLPEILTMAAVHIALLLLVTPLLHEAVGLVKPPDRPGDWLREWFHPDGALLRFVTVWFWELLLPLLPGTLVLCFVRRSDWPRGFWVLLALLPYALLCTFILVDEQGEAIRERGAYFLPWVIFALLLFVWRLLELSERTRGLFLALCVLLGMAGYTAKFLHDDRPGEAFGAVLRTITEGEPTWMLCAGGPDLEWTLLENAEVNPLMVTSLVTKPTEQLLAELPGFEAAILGRLDAGERVLASEAVFAEIEALTPEIQQNLALLRQWLEARFRLEPLGEEPYRFRELHRR